MRVEKNEDGKIIRLVISERNALALLEKLKWDSARTIKSPCEELLLSIEPDDVHYANREPGSMLNAKGNTY